MGEHYTPSSLLMQLGIGPISLTMYFGQFLYTFQQNRTAQTRNQTSPLPYDPKLFCFVGIHCMRKNGKYATAAIAPQPRISLLCHRKYSCIFRNIPLKIAQWHKWHIFPVKFSPEIAGPPRPLCQQT